LSLIWRWCRPIRTSLLLISLISITASLLSLAVTLVTRELIDGAVGGDQGALIRNGIILVLLIVTLRVSSVVTSVLRNRATVRFQQELQHAVTGALLDKEYASVKPYHSGDLVSRIFSDAAVVRNGVLNILPSVLSVFASFTGAAAILISMDWRFVPVLIIGGLLGILITFVFRKPVKHRHKRMQEAESALLADTQEMFENLRVIKASLSEDRAMKQMDEKRERLGKEQLRNGRLNVIMNNGMGIMFDLSWLVCNLWGFYRIYRHEFTYGSLAAMIQLISRIQTPIANALAMIGQVYAVTASAERLEELLVLPQEEKTERLEHFDRIELENLTFQYEDGTDEVLFNVSGTIRCGECVALTGRSGGGKTSLFQLLLGIYRPKNGSIWFYDGERRMRAGRGTRSLFAYVPQGNTLFSGTLRENLMRFTDSATDEQIAQAVRAACIDDLVNEAGLDTLLGERGIGLSEGQAQRIAIARALLNPAPILLLDEATSALDEETEAKLLKNISALKEKTILIVTHRPAALDICSVQWHIEDGRMRVTRSA